MQKLLPLFRRMVRTAKRALPLLFSRRLLVGAVLFWVPVLIFIKLAEEVQSGDTLTYDRALLNFIYGPMSSPQLDPYIVAVTNLGSPVGVAIMTTVAVLALLGLGYRRAAVFVTAVIGGATVMNSLLKLLFARDRPSLFETIVTETSYSFPSGHAMISSAMAFAAILLAWPTRWRWPVLALATLYFVTVSFTRLYLGVHYPTDIIAGWLISAAWVAVVYYGVRLNRHAAGNDKVA